MNFVNFIFDFRLKMEKLIQTMILATDITQQSTILSIFRVNKISINQ